MGKIFGAAGVVDEFEGLFGVHLCCCFFVEEAGRGLGGILEVERFYAHAHAYTTGVRMGTWR